MSNSIVDQMNQTPLEPKKKKVQRILFSFRDKVRRQVFLYMYWCANTKVTTQ